jgi:hypothetical protein
VQPGDPGHPFRQPAPGQPPPRLVLQLHIVVIFRPVVPDQHQHRSAALLPVTISAE